MHDQQVPAMVTQRIVKIFFLRLLIALEKAEFCTIPRELIQCRRPHRKFVYQNQIPNSICKPYLTSSFDVSYFKMAIETEKSLTTQITAILSPGMITASYTSLQGELVTCYMSNRNQARMEAPRQGPLPRKNQKSINSQMQITPQLNCLRENYLWNTKPIHLKTPLTGLLYAISLYIEIQKFSTLTENLEQKDLQCRSGHIRCPEQRHIHCTSQQCSPHYHAGVQPVRKRTESAANGCISYWLCHWSPCLQSLK